MVQKKILLVLSLLIFGCATLCAQKTYPEWTKTELAKANTAVNTSLSEDEKLVFFYCNLARLNGAKFLRTYAANYLTGSDDYVTSLKKELSQIKNLPMLKPDKGLCQAAAFHAEDMYKNGFCGHKSSDGTSCSKRVYRYYNGEYIFGGENIAKGYYEPLDVVMAWLIDSGIPSHGHRHSILSELSVAMGVSIDGSICVQDFGQELLTPMD
jgi:uncharacterized protein YkwD